MFSASTTDTFDATQEAVVVGEVQVTDANGIATIAPAGSVDIPAGGACDGSDSGSIAVTITNQGQPLGIAVSGSCGSSNAPLTLQQPATVCVTAAQYIVSAEQLDAGSTLVLVDSNGNQVPTAATGGTNAQACGLVSTPGTYSIGVLVPSSS